MVTGRGYTSNALPIPLTKNEALKLIIFLIIRKAGVGVQRNIFPFALIMVNGDEFLAERLTTF